LSTVLKVKSDVIYCDRFCTRQLDNRLTGGFKKNCELSPEELRTGPDMKKTLKAQDSPEPIYTVTRPNPTEPRFCIKKNHM
jgi:hypothetical protein